MENPTPVDPIPAPKGQARSRASKGGLNKFRAADGHSKKVTKNDDPSETEVKPQENASTPGTVSPQGSSEPRSTPDPPRKIAQRSRRPTRTALRDLMGLHTRQNTLILIAGRQSSVPHGNSGEAHPQQKSSSSTDVPFRGATHRHDAEDEHRPGRSTKHSADPKQEVYYSKYDTEWKSRQFWKTAKATKYPQNEGWPTRDRDMSLKRPTGGTLHTTRLVGIEKAI